MVREWIRQPDGSYRRHRGWVARLYHDPEPWALFIRGKLVATFPTADAAMSAVDDKELR